METFEKRKRSFEDEIPYVQDVFWDEETLEAILRDSPIRQFETQPTQELIPPHHSQAIQRTANEICNLPYFNNNFLDEKMIYLFLEGDNGTCGIYKALNYADKEYNQIQKIFQKEGIMFPPGTEPKLKVKNIIFK